MHTKQYTFTMFHNATMTALERQKLLERLQDITPTATMKKTGGCENEITATITANASEIDTEALKGAAELLARSFKRFINGKAYSVGVGNKTLFTERL